MEFYFSLDRLYVHVYYDLHNNVFLNNHQDFLALISIQWKSFLTFLITNPKIPHIHFVWAMLLDCTVVNTIHNCVVYEYILIACWWPNYSNVFCEMMTSLPITKQPPVLASAAETATSFKMMQFTCTGPFRCSHTYFEGILHKKKYPVVGFRACGSVRYNTSVLLHKLTSKAWDRTTAFGWVAV